MEFYEPLPNKISLKNSNQFISDELINRLNYEWKLIHELALTSLPLSHMMSRSFKDLCRYNHIDLDLFITKKLCSWCSIIQIPSITCRVRVRKRSKRSKINQDKNINKNEVVYHCLTCNNISYRINGCQKTHKPSKPATTPSTPKITTPSAPIQKLNKKFNFIEMANRKETPKKTLEFPSNSDFISLNSISSTTSSTTTTPIHQKKRISLLELEEMSKSSKKKQKRVEIKDTKHTNTTNYSHLDSANRIGNNSSNSNPSLGSLKSLFKTSN